MNTDNETYNGWANWETWNVALWIENDEGFYDFAKSVKRARDPYAHFGEDMKEMGVKATPDGVLWNDPKIDFKAINEMIEEL